MGFRAAMCLGKSVDALAHDCSTLGGNSGSALLDIEAETVVGLHFGGEYLVANHAVPTAALAQDRRFADHGVIFS
jgi:endonuclease G